MRLPLTQSKEKRSETRVTAECKYRNFHRLTKKFKKGAAKIIPLLSYFLFQNQNSARSFQCVLAQIFVLPPIQQELNSILLHTELGKLGFVYLAIPIFIAAITRQYFKGKGRSFKSRRPRAEILELSQIPRIIVNL